MELSKSQNRIFGLDLMRAVAILLVLAGHCSWIFSESDAVFSPLLALSGFLGVEIFFVLSGFLIGRIIYRQFTESDFDRNAVLYFLKRRWFRTLPNYFLILMVNLIIAFFLNYKVDGLWQYFFFLQNFSAPMLPFFTESWSLSVEEFAYVILPLSLLGAFALSNAANRRTRFLWVVLLLISIFLTTKIIYHANTANSTIDQWNLALKSVVIFRLDSIFIGVLAAWISVNFPGSWQRAAKILTVAGMAMIAFYTFGVGFLGLFIDRYPFFWNVVYLPLASVSIAFFLPVLSGWKTAKGVLKTPITFIALISYSMYLLHYGVVLQTMKHFVATENLTSTWRLVFTLVYIIVTIFFSALLYRYFEKPMTDMRPS